MSRVFDLSESRRVVFPWSTWPMIVTTGVRFTHSLSGAASLQDKIDSHSANKSSKRLFHTIHSLWNDILALLFSFHYSNREFRLVVERSDCFHDSFLREKRHQIVVSSKRYTWSSGSSSTARSSADLSILVRTSRTSSKDSSMADDSSLQA